MKEINDLKIKGNIFKENIMGINIEGFNWVIYFYNIFEKNGWVIKLRGVCYINIFLENNFFYNIFDLLYNSKLNDNLFKNNYWSDYSGYDLNKDGIGDVLYKLVKLFLYVVNRILEVIIFLRSFFIDIIDFFEKVLFVFIFSNFEDIFLKMKCIVYDRN